MQQRTVFELAKRVVAISTSSAFVPTVLTAVGAFEGFCQLTRLTSLVLNELEPDQQQQHSLGALSQLSALQNLELGSSMDGFFILRPPPELSRLHALRRLDLSDFACCGVFCELPRLTYLSVSQHQSEESDVHVPDLLYVPSNLTFLPQLAEVCLRNVILNSSLLGLGFTSLTGLTG